MSFAKYKKIDELQTRFSAADIAAIANEDIVDRINDWMVLVNAALAAKSATGATVLLKIASLSAPA